MNGSLVPETEEEEKVRVCLLEGGFEPGDVRSEKRMRVKRSIKCGTMMTPLMWACYKGELEVCKWLYHHGASSDISRASSGEAGYTPMHYACITGHLPVCEWLCEVGADADISRAGANGRTPASLAFCSGHPGARRQGLCAWLVLNGAFDRAGPSTAASAEQGGQAGHAAWEAVERDTGSCGDCPALLVWAWGVLDTHRAFFHHVLSGSVTLPASQQHAAPGERCLLPRLFLEGHVIMRHVGSFLGVETGRRLRNVREFAHALVKLRWGGYLHGVKVWDGVGWSLGRRWVTAPGWRFHLGSGGPF